MKDKAKSFNSGPIVKYILVFLAILVAISIVAQGAVSFGPAVLGLLGIPFILLSIYNYRFGIVSLFLIGSFMFVVERILRTDLPYGILFDLLIVLIFISLAIKSSAKEKLNFYIKEPITIANIIFFIYFGLQVLNPHATSIMAWVAAIRQNTIFLFFIILLTYFKGPQIINRFLYLWYAIAIFVALYGLKQEFIGLADFEWQFIHATADRYMRYFNWGHMRTFSILSDPSSFGLFMAFSGLSTLTLSFGPFKLYKRVLLIIITLIIFGSMVFSGTRTAYAMVVAGVVFFIVLNINNYKVLAGSMVLVLAFLVLMFGPFYSGPILRMRSTFNLSEDASMNVRDNTRLMYQNYILQHPIGGGVNTTGNIGLKHSPSHPLAGYPPDSGYLRTALELGWIGLILVLAINMSIVYTGIKNQHQLKSKRLKSYNLAFLVPFFSLTIANYAQDAMFGKPIIIPVLATYAIVIKLKEFNDSPDDLDK